MAWKKLADVISEWLLVVGGLNWGLDRLLSWNLVDKIFMRYPFVDKLIYALVFASAIFVILRKAKIIKGEK